jgi:hypothetical protein
MANTIGKFRKATATEKQAWLDAPMPGEPSLTLNLYPLRGYIAYNQMELAVEKTSDGLFEVHAPDGRHFSPYVLHTMLCADMSDLRERLSVYDLEACNEGCGSGSRGEHWVLRTKWPEFRNCRIFMLTPITPEL